eukprot:COSAG01_NODE_3224_length_6388_cov_10.896009_6_plen_180_part_00
MIWGLLKAKCCRPVSCWCVPEGVEQLRRHHPGQVSVVSSTSRRAGLVELRGHHYERELCGGYTPHVVYTPVSFLCELGEHRAAQRALPEYISRARADAHAKRPLYLAPRTTTSSSSTSCCCSGVSAARRCAAATPPHRERTCVQRERSRGLRPRSGRHLYTYFMIRTKDEINGTVGESQ